jgi:hypothetical protein
MTNFAKKMQELDPNNFNKKPLRPLTLWVSQCDCEQKEAERKERRKANIERIKELRKVYKQAGFSRRQLGMRLRHL